MMTPSRIYRLGRAVRILRILSIVGIIVLLIVTVYSLALTGTGLLSAVEGSSGTNDFTFTSSFSMDFLVLNLSVLLTNKGFFGIDALEVQAYFNNSTLAPGSIGEAQAGPATVPGDGALNLTLSAPFDTAGVAGTFLLAHNASLDLRLWVNATYAELLPLGLGLPVSGFPWLAPFEGLSYVAGAPTGVTPTHETVPITTSFANEVLPLTIRGNLSEVFTAPNGTRCGSDILTVDAGAGVFSQTEPVLFEQPCATVGDNVTAVLTGPGYGISLPREVLS
jgi:hypothetical protein